MLEMQELLSSSVKFGASDIHIVPLRPPLFRINGDMLESESSILTPEDTQRIIFAALPKKLVERFEAENELDASIEAEGVGARFRINVHRQKDGVGAVLRVIPSAIPTAEEIGLEPQLVKLTEAPRGLILVTGPTGSGKSTTLACLINIINQGRREHILTIEDPIEYVYPKGTCVITQREIGPHSSSFAHALKRALRQDPDIILIGEMRDLETIGVALTLAETGHLVFGTLHTTDAPQTIDRIIDVFPPYQQQQVRTQLSVTLRAVACQQLLPRASGDGRVAAREIMIVSPAIANLIREGKTHQIYSAIETGGRGGMKSLDRDLADLVRKKVVTLEVAAAKANDPEQLKRFAGGGSA
ncbi:MAG TPA: type IV pilus twitching motility protein PilT [Verrucomicrobiae bacterium]|nr:type IV pilus twitching motility protein PilT [Verrucomicrobiae bacterium]